VRNRKEPTLRCATVAPRRVGEEAEMAGHKFKVGQVVDFAQPRLALPTVHGLYEIVGLLPSDGAQFQYRIKAAGESFERMARESQLTLQAFDDEA
jgi:hypothetical protein